MAQVAGVGSVMAGKAGSTAMAWVDRAVSPGWEIPLMRPDPFEAETGAEFQVMVP